jgi:hypothetical protein
MEIWSHNFYNNFIIITIIFFVKGIFSARDHEGVDG